VNAQIEIESSVEDVTFEVQERVFGSDHWVRTSRVMYSLESAQKEWEFHQAYANVNRTLRLSAVRRTTIVVNEVLES
jgi:hypothetical protein